MKRWRTRSFHLVEIADKPPSNRSQSTWKNYALDNILGSVLYSFVHKEKIQIGLPLIMPE